MADDSDFFRGQIQRLVEGVGCRVLAAEDGQAAWELLDQHAGEVDLVATDIEMPRLDGLALTRQIRADRRFSGLPVIALSSLAGEEEIARGMAAGVDEYQIKLNKDELTDSIRKAVASKKHDLAPRDVLQGNQSNGYGIGERNRNEADAGPGRPVSSSSRDGSRPTTLSYRYRVIKGLTT